MALTALAIIVAAFLTSVLSGIIGMAGGVILIAALVFLLPVPSAMILHGILQGVANGTRSWLLRKHILWHILPTYFLGVACVAVFFLWSTIVVNAAVVLVVVGCFPWISQFLPKSLRLDITSKPTTFACGIVVTVAQFIAGASGPVLDAFYQRNELTRYQIVANKALTQTLGHIFKVIYFSYIIVIKDEFELTGISWWLVVLAVAGSILGTRLGTSVLDRISDERFRRITNIFILAIGTAIAFRGLYELLS